MNLRNTLVLGDNILNIKENQIGLGACMQIFAMLMLLTLNTGSHATALDEPILPISPPSFSELEKKQIELGRRLFLEPRLSSDNTVSCASCHRMELAGTDGQKVSIGVGGAMGGVNAPTVINSGFNFAQFWDGRASTLEEQAAGPIHNSAEMNSNWDEVLEKLKEDPYYVERFEELYGDAVKPASIQHAISMFERSLVTVNSPFDRFLQGDSDAITEEAKKGYRLFKSYGCVACHQGRNVGGNMYSRMGVLDDFFGEKDKLTKADMGRYNVTGRDEDKHVFKVPSLRLVTKTAPYFHNGSVNNLEDAISTMARYQLGRRIKDEDIVLIIAFLKSLSGDLYEVEQ